MDLDIDAFARAFQQFIEATGEVARRHEESSGELTEVGTGVQEFLGVELAGVEPVTETFPVLQVVDLDLALEALLADLGGER